MKKKILLVDDHPIVLNGIKSMIESLDGFEVTGALSNPLHVFDYLKTFDIDILITDLEMPEMNGMELVKKVKADYTCKVVLLTMHSERSKLDEAMEYGIDGYILKDSDRDEFVFALNKVAKGKSFYSSTLLESDINDEKKQSEATENLTSREVEVLKLVAEGFSNVEISERLFLSPKTVDSHRTNMMKKLDVHNVVGLVRYAIKNKIVKLE